MSSFGEHASLVNGTYESDGSKTAINSTKRGYKKFFRKFFFDPKFAKNLYFLFIFGQKFDKSSEPAEIDRRREACNSAK